MAPQYNTAFPTILCSSEIHFSSFRLSVYAIASVIQSVSVWMLVLWALSNFDFFISAVEGPLLYLQKPLHVN